MEVCDCGHGGEKAGVLPPWVDAARGPRRGDQSTGRGHLSNEGGEAAECRMAEGEEGEVGWGGREVKVMLRCVRAGRAHPL